MSSSKNGSDLQIKMGGVNRQIHSKDLSVEQCVYVCVWGANYALKVLAK